MVGRCEISRNLSQKSMHAENFFSEISIFKNFDKKSVECRKASKKTQRRKKRVLSKMGEKIARFSTLQKPDKKPSNFSFTHAFSCSRFRHSKNQSKLKWLSLI